MKTAISILLAFALASLAGADNPAESPQLLKPETTLHVAALYLNDILIHALDSLELVAATPEAKKGDWNGIKAYLERLEPSLPGVYFFVLPDGNYYTVTKDFTNLNLSDRAYFKSLFSGTPVKGFPMYSRSSGKKTTLMAAPIIMTDGKVFGALGISIFLDGLDARMNQALALPPNYTWYVLNPEGDTLLHKASDFIFMNALKQAGKSLKIAASEAMKSDHGTMQYELGTTRYAYYQKLPDIDWWMFLTEIKEGETPVPPQLKLSLEHFAPDLQRTLDQIDESLAKSIDATGADIGSESEIRQLLGAVLDDNLSVFEAAYVDAKGSLRYIEPGDYKNFENTDINDQEHVIAMLKEPSPQFTGGFQAVEGFQAVVIARPLYDSEKRFAGSVNVVIRPELLIDGLLEKTTIPDGYELWIMQLDGMIIYDEDKGEIGKMLFEDPIYADYGNLLELGRKIISSPSGEGSYIYLSPQTGEKVIKNAIWQTVKLHGREWRAVLAYRPYE